MSQQAWQCKFQSAGSKMQDLGMVGTEASSAFPNLSLTAALKDGTLCRLISRHHDLLRAS